MNVAFYDLHRHDEPIRDELEEACRRVIRSGHFILGPEVEAFEAEFAAYCGAKHCIGVGNGLDALHLSLLAMGIGAGDEVIVPAQTFIATWLSVSYAGARPVPVDVDAGTANLSPDLIERAITPRTRAIMPVHLFGQPAQIDEIAAIARRHGLRIVEDAAQAHGAEYQGRRAGTLGDAAAFSFYPSKNLGAFGDGGAVVCDDEALASRIRMLRNYGSRVKYLHEVRGFNSRLDEMQAAVLRVKLKHLDAWNERRRGVAQRYTNALRGAAGSAIEAPVELPQAKSVWHLYVVRCRYRNRLASQLSRHGVQTLMHYPQAPMSHAAYAGHGADAGAYPEAQRFARECLSLPMAPYLSDAEVEHVVASVAAEARRLAA